MVEVFMVPMSLLSKIFTTYAYIAPCNSLNISINGSYKKAGEVLFPFFS